MTDQSLTILAFDCSTSACSAAVRGPSGLLAVERAAGRGQAEAMVPLIGAVLAKAGCGWPDIDLIGVTVGPGSFTGLRIGLAAARALSLARGLPIAGITTADLLAFSLPDAARGRPFLIAIDSKRDDLFVQPFGADGSPAGEIAALPPEQALAAWGNPLAGPLLVAGDAAEAFRPLRADIEVLPLLPDAAPLTALALRRWTEKRALPAQPLYLRPPDVAAPAQ
jgi:tRNA threonylcarbamoyladenosine biosynthesis protein TsaB